jgi:inner membrane transporter RhtA
MDGQILSYRHSRRGNSGTLRLPTLESVPAPALVLTAIASVQMGSAIAARLFDRAGPAGIVLLRLAFGAVIMLALSRPRIRGRSRHSLGLAVMFGVALAAMNWSFYEALSRMPLGPAVTIEFIGPLAVAVAGSRRALDAVWVVLAAAGVVLLTSGGVSGVTAAGILLAALAGFFWGCYILLSQRVGQHFPGVTGLSLALGVGAVLMVPAGLVGAGGRIGSGTVLLGGVAVALLSSVVPYSLELTALRSLPSGVFGVLMSIEPAMAALAGVIVLHQHLLPREYAAIGCVVLASAGATLTARRGVPVVAD